MWLNIVIREGIWVMLLLITPQTTASFDCLQIKILFIPLMNWNASTALIFQTLINDLLTYNNILHVSGAEFKL